MDLLTKLNEKQREAALHTKGALLVLAGAGSGKTSMMTHRIARMIIEDGIDPQCILAVTFTNKAAGEMKERVGQLLGGHINMWITTFHSACLRILRAHIQELGYKSNFTIYDTADQKAAVKQCMIAEEIDDKMYPVPYILSLISKSKDAGITANRFERENQGDSQKKKVAAVYKRYEKLLKKNNALDFDDLIMKTVELFNISPETLSVYQEKFQYIMVDEYQDTNRMQYQFISMLASKNGNICVVGDDDQCIYQWRGANIRNILEFEKDFKDVTVIKLEQNYRSTGTILEAAHSVIKNNSARKAKKLWTENNGGEKIKYFQAANERDEAFYIAREIDRLQGRDLKYSDFAILYRTHTQSRALEETLSAKEIPHRILGGLRFYERKEIKDILSYLRLAQNLSDDISLKRIINEPKRGIGGKTLQRLEQRAEEQGESLFSILSDTKTIEEMTMRTGQNARIFVETIYRCAMEKDHIKVSELYDNILAESGYVRALEEQGTVEAAGRIENLQEFKSVIYDYENEGGELFLEEFLERISLMTDIDNHDAGENAVVLMTLHSAKGLEFPVVFMPGMENGIFPGRRAFDSEGGINEERRLCYVGITRAKQQLYMTNARLRMLYGRTEKAEPSIFMKEIDKRLLDVEAIQPKKKESFIQPSQTGGTRFNPYDQLRYIREQNKGKSSDPSKMEAGIRVGDKVRHAKFGEGMVVSLKPSGGNTLITVVFDKVGIKQLSLELAGLKKI